MRIIRGELNIAPETSQLFNDLICSLGAIVKLLRNEPFIFSISASTVSMQNDSLTF